MLNALDAHPQNQRQVHVAVDADITVTNKPDTSCSRLQPSESIGPLIGGIAHDFNNMLNSILMSATLLQMGRSAQEQDHLLKIIQASAERSAAMVKGLMALVDLGDRAMEACWDRLKRAG
jgi:nitrogen-specific signal transduction histidine kinase